MTTKTLKTKALKLLRQYEKTEPEARTPIAKRLAETFVDARELFTDADGNPDWRGKTYPYRIWVRDLFAEANLRDEEANRVQSAIRYHTGTVLRSRLTSEQLEDLGMIPQTPRERSHERRAARTAVLNTLNAREVAGGALLGLTAAKAIVDRLDLREVGKLDEHEAAVAKSAIEGLEKRLRALKKALD